MKSARTHPRVGSPEVQPKRTMSVLTLLANPRCKSASWDGATTFHGETWRSIPAAGQALNIPGKMMDGAGGGENYGASRSEGQADQALAGDFEIGLAVGCDLHDAARAGERSGDVEIAIDVEGQSLRASQAFVERAHRAVGIDFVDASRCGSGDEQIALRAEGQVIGGDAELERGKDEDLLVAGDLEDGAVAVADVETLLAIEGDAGGDAHAFGVGGHGSVGSDAIDRAVVSAKRRTSVPGGRRRWRWRSSSRRRMA